MLLRETRPALKADTAVAQDPSRPLLRHRLRPGDSPPALRHRVLLNFEAESRSVSADAVIRQILQSVPEGG